MNRISPQMLGLTGGDVTLFTGRTAADTAADGRAPALRRLLAFALRWRWVLLGGLVAGIVAGLVLTLAMTRQYASTARLEISRDTARVVNIDSVQRDTSIGDQEFYQTQYGLLQTQTLAERVARDLGVVDDPAFFKRFGRDDLFKASAKTAGPAGAAKRNEIAGRILLHHVSVAPVRGSRLVDVRVVTPDPVLSQKIARVWGEDFIASNLERRFEASSYARHFLEVRLDQLRDKLEASEREAIGYAASHGIINLPSPGAVSTGGAIGDRSLLTDDLAALNAALEVATNERILAQSRLREAQRPDASSEALGNLAIGAIRQKRAEAAADYQKLMVQFEPNYPQAKALESQIKALDAAISQEENRVRTSLEQAYDAAAARERALTAQVSGLKAQFADLRRLGVQYNIFQRDADTNRQLYGAVLQRYKEIGVAGGIENNNVAVVDAAKLPDRPSSPRLLVNILLGMFAGLGLGAAIAGVLAQIDDGIDAPSEVPEKLGLPLLGTAPRIKLGTPLEALSHRRSNLTEAYLAVQANLELSTAHGVPKSLALISTRPREGKSVSTIALAQSLARARRKVVLVDVDLRSPSIHSAFGLSNTVGVSNFLSGDDDIDAMLRRSPHEDLWVITAGPQPPNAADLLMNDRLARLIKRLQERFDHVVVDSPPMIGLADAPLVAAAVEHVVYVVEAKAVPIASARVALNRLRGPHVNILGVVLTKYEAKRTRTGDGYGFDYEYNYGR